MNIHTLKSQGRTSQWNKACEELSRHKLQLDKLMFGLTVQSSSSSSSSSSENEEEPHKLKTKVSPFLKGYERRNIKEQKISIKTGSKVETDTQESESKDKLKPVKRKLVKENITSTTESLKDPDVVEDEIINSSSQDLVQYHMNKIRTEMECEKRRTFEQLIEQHKEEIALLQENHNIALNEVKKKKWCANCQHEATLHCCQNTSYCSTKCQLIRWNSEHKYYCRRPR
eukprot:XP_016661972.1 PREDICTED: zinc finger MYND domain-containing protein 11-like [Acyrthosiphon pisum]